MPSFLTQNVQSCNLHFLSPAKLSEPKDLFATFMLELLLLLLSLLLLSLLLLRLLMTLTIVFKEISENVIKLEIEKHFSPNPLSITKFVLLCCIILLHEQIKMSYAPNRIVEMNFTYANKVTFFQAKIYVNLTQYVI